MGPGRSLSIASMPTALPPKCEPKAGRVVFDPRSFGHNRCAANSWNTRIRVKQQIERLRQEISLLCEEMRIKDVRMELIPAPRRPYFAGLGSREKSVA
jgi:hypothetical protein